MFPDPHIIWRPYPSVIDGIKAPPFVFDRGLSRGVLHLAVYECMPGIRSFGVEISCEIYGAFEEMVYSTADHGDQRSRYDGNIYIKEAEHSSVLETFKKLWPHMQKPRHFLFVGGDYCYETLGFAEPVIQEFGSTDQADKWRSDGRFQREDIA